MKKLIIVSITLLMFTLFQFSCKKETVSIDSNAEIEIGPGLSEDDVETYQGEIGIYINARDIARKGYKPAYASISGSGTMFDTIGLLPIDEYTNLAALSFQIENLTEEQREALKTNGVALDITVYDENQTELGSIQESNVFFNSSPTNVNMPLSLTLPDINNNILAFREGVNYYLQIVDPQTNNVRYAVGSVAYSNSDNPVSQTYSLQGLLYEDETSQAFLYSKYQFKPVPNQPGVFTIALHIDGKVFYLHETNQEIRVQNLYNWEQNGGEVSASSAKYKFKIEPADAGYYTFRSMSTGNLLTQEVTQRLRAGSSNPTPEDIAYFRIINFDIDWNFTPLDYKQLQPIMPPARTDFGYNSTLINCSSGDLQQEVGREQTKEMTLTSGWEESMSISSNSSITLSITQEAEVSTKFFGAGGKAKQTVSGSISIGVSASKSSVRSKENSSKKSVTVSSKRTINVPSRKATLISDMYQTYTNIEIPFVQRYRVQADYQDAWQGALTGEEIMAQFSFNGFSGVVTRVEENYILVTVRGVNRIDELIEINTVAKDLATDCD